MKIEAEVDCDFLLFLSCFFSNYFSQTLEKQEKVWVWILKLRIRCLKMGSMSSNIHQNVGNWTRNKLAALNLRFKNFCSTLFAFEIGSFSRFFTFCFPPYFRPLNVRFLLKNWHENFLQPLSFLMVPKTSSLTLYNPPKIEKEAVFLFFIR